MKFTDKIFRDSPELRQELEAALNGNAMQIALSIIEDSAKIRSTVQPKQYAPLDSLIAHQHHKQAGIQKAVDDLWRLIEPNPVVEESTPDRVKELQQEPYFQNLPKIMQDAWLNQVRAESA